MAQADRSKGIHSSIAYVIKESMNSLLAEQSPDGAWHHGFEMGVMPDAQTAIFLYVLGHTDPSWLDGLLGRIAQAQHADGSWGPYDGASGDLSTTVECYYALAIYQRWVGRECEQRHAESFILKNGGLRGCRNLTKVLLAIGGELSWDDLPSPAIYTWLWSRFSPIQIRDMVTFTRLHVASIVILSTLRYVSPRVDQALLSHLLGPCHTSARRRRILPVPRFLLTNCLQYLYSEREQDGTLAGYHSATFLFLCVQEALPSDAPLADTAATIAAVRRVWGCPFGETPNHQQTCDAHVWNTALTLGALRHCRLSGDHEQLRKAVRFLASKQHITQWNAYDRSYHPGGGWGFSSNNTRHPDIDDTVACLEALLNIPDYPVSDWERGLTWLLSRQNRDGGWSAFDQNCAKTWLERIPANDMRHAIADPSTPDLTGRTLALLLCSGARSSESHAVRKGVQFLLRTQEKDGSWYGRWGSTYLYGTWCAIRGLSVASATADGPRVQALTRARMWLLDRQNTDGSFGESCQSDQLGRYEPLGYGVASQTAWALDAFVLLYGQTLSGTEKRKLRLAMDQAANWLVRTCEHGQWREAIPTGSAFPGALHIRYHLYPKLWPLYALAHYESIQNMG
ncbi:MAG: hypothetical protein OWT28_01510 [Firmicutes bacterium]|nr:hypothetical protein [Bacillota bacterium]